MAETMKKENLYKSATLRLEAELAEERRTNQILRMGNKSLLNDGTSGLTTVHRVQTDTPITPIAVPVAHNSQQIEDLARQVDGIKQQIEMQSMKDQLTRIEVMLQCQQHFNTASNHSPPPPPGFPAQVHRQWSMPPYGYPAPPSMYHQNMPNYPAPLQMYQQPILQPYMQPPPPPFMMQAPPPPPVITPVYPQVYARLPYVVPEEKKNESGRRTEARKVFGEPFLTQSHIVNRRELSSKSKPPKSSSDNAEDSPNSDPVSAECQTPTFDTAKINQYSDRATIVSSESAEDPMKSSDGPMVVTSHITQVLSTSSDSPTIEPSDNSLNLSSANVSTQDQNQKKDTPAVITSEDVQDPSAPVLISSVLEHQRPNPTFLEKTSLKTQAR
jgi:hypothetical protein